jgi:hypothetical protein
MRERLARAEETRERRRKPGIGAVIGRRLAVLESELDFNSFSYRWINDSEARFMAKTREDDWELVPNNDVKDDSADLGTAVSQIVGSKPDGSALKAYLCRKPKRWYEDDRAEKQAELDKQLEQIRVGNDRDGGSQSDYVPSGGINFRVTRG